MAKKQCKEGRDQVGDLSDGEIFEPQAIYFDTSFLYQLYFNSNVDPILNYAEHLDIPLLVPDTVLHELTEERKRQLDEHRKNMDNIIGKLNSMFSEESYHVGAPERPPEGLVEDATRTLLERHGMEIVPLPACLTLVQLLELALKHTPPFERDDKGFKDAVILETIVDDMTKRKLNRALLATRDGIFSRNEIVSRLNQMKIEMRVVPDVESATRLLEQVADSRADSHWTQYKQEVLEFLNGQFTEIGEFIRKNLRIQSGGIFPREPHPDLPSTSMVKEVTNVQPKNITDIQFWDFKKQYVENVKEPWYIEVATEFDLLIKYSSDSSDSSLWGTSVLLSETQDLEKARRKFWEPWQETSKKVVRNVMLEALVTYSEDGPPGLELIEASVNLP